MSLCRCQTHFAKKLYLTALRCGDVARHLRARTLADEAEEKNLGVMDCKRVWSKGVDILMRGRVAVLVQSKLKEQRADDTQYNAPVVTHGATTYC